MHLYPILYDSFRSRWTNFFHSEDLFGVPLASVFGCNDIEVLDAGPPTEIVGDVGILAALAAHNCFWSSDAIAKHVADQVLACSQGVR